VSSYKDFLSDTVASSIGGHCKCQWTRLATKTAKRLLLLTTTWKAKIFFSQIEVYTLKDSEDKLGCIAHPEGGIYLSMQPIPDVAIGIFIR
jgi:hypothetical protein